MCALPGNRLPGPANYGLNNGHCSIPTSQATLTTCTSGYVTSNLYYRLLKVYESLYNKVEECRQPIEANTISSTARQVVLASP